MTTLNHFVLHLKSKHSVTKEEYKARSKFKNARQRTHTINTNLKHSVTKEEYEGRYKFKYAR